MNRLGLSLAVSPAMLFVCTVLQAAEPTTPAVTQEKGAPATSAPTAPAASETVRQRARQAIQKEFDKDSDGKLSAAEKAEARQAMQDRQKARKAAAAARNADTTAPKAPRKDANALREIARERFDRDGDGKLNDTERAEMREKAKELREKGPQERQAANSRGGIKQEMISRFDANKDGSIDDTEFKAMESTLRQRMDTAPGLAKRFDQNADGKVDNVEWVTAESKIKRWLNDKSDNAPAKRNARPEAK